MNNLNVISFSQLLYPGDQDLTNLLHGIAPTHKKFNETDFTQQLSPKLEGVNLFIFDNASLKNNHLGRAVEKFLQDTPRLINICILTSDINIPENISLFSGFHDFLIWPCSKQEIQTRLYRFLQPQPQKLLADNALLNEFAHLHLTGQSPVFIKTISLIKKMANCHAPVLIQGETGTGKENAARAIHYLSDRRDRAFIPINCAAIPDELIESELFGHEKGSFTDAKTTQLGLISLAQGGTLFLDEVDSLTPKAQATLLRFLQTQEYRPLGSKTTLQADVRILAATNANLRELSQHKLFREDLYFRLNVLSLYMPPLRERVTDIPLIVSALIDKFSLQHKIPAKNIHSTSMNYLMQQRWPGNIRELENLLLRSFLLSSGTMLIIEQQTSNDIINTCFELAEAELNDNEENSTVSQFTGRKKSKAPALSFQAAKAVAITHFEKNYLEEIMTITDGNVSAAARLAGKERRALGKLLQKYQIQKSNFQIVHDQA